MDKSRRSVSFRELEAEENPLRDMFYSSPKRVINCVELEYFESQPAPKLCLPDISSSEVYADLSMFHIKDVTRIYIKECISQIQENSDFVQTLSLLDTKKL